MLTNTWIYDAIIYTYALSLLFYFSDVVGFNRGAKRMGTGFLIFVWVLQTALLVVRLYSHPLSMFTRFEFLFLFSWTLVTSSLVIKRFFHIEYIVFFVNLFGFAVLFVNLLVDADVSSSMLEWEMMRNMLVFHVALAAAGIGCFTISAVYAGMYIFLHQRLKTKKWSDAVRRLPSLERMQHASLTAAGIGVVLFILSLTIAVTVVLLGSRNEILLDFKVWFTLLVLCSYGLYIAKRRNEKWTGLQIAGFNLICYAILLSNYAVNSVSTFHDWWGA